MSKHKPNLRPRDEAAYGAEYSGPTPPSDLGVGPEFVLGMIADALNNGNVTEAHEYAKQEGVDLNSAAVRKALEPMLTRRGRSKASGTK